MNSTSITKPEVIEQDISQLRTESEQLYDEIKELSARVAKLGRETSELLTNLKENNKEALEVERQSRALLEELRRMNKEAADIIKESTTASITPSSAMVNLDNLTNTISTEKTSLNKESRTSDVTNTPSKPYPTKFEISF